MKQRKIPMRMCIGCHQNNLKKDMIRIVRAPENARGEDLNEGALKEFSLDLSGKKPGRGAYLCRNSECMRIAKKGRKLDKAFETKVPEEVYDKLLKQIEELN